MQERLLTFNEVVERYKFKPWGLRHMMRLRKIPMVRLGRRIYFDPVDLESWINNGKIPVQNGDENEK